MQRGRAREKPQPAGTKFKVPAIDAPNVNGARDLGLPVGAGNDGAPDLSALRTAVEPGRVRRSTCSIPVPTARSATCRGSSRRGSAGKLPLLIDQGVLMTELARAADIVLPGAAWVEKDAHLHERPGPRAGGARRCSRRRARRWTTARSSSGVADGARASAAVARRRPRCARPSPRTLPANPRYAGLGTIELRAPG